MKRSTLCLCWVATVLCIVGCRKETLSGPPVVTKAESGQIKPGMSLKQVQEIIGEPGKEMEVQPEQARQRMTQRLWANPDGSLLTVLFQDERVQITEPINLK